jgi:hypothetical protein
MADTKITALTAISTVDPAVDVLPIVDVSDTTMAASGTTKKITSNQILGAGGTATLASATITGDLTVDTSTLKVDSANNRVGFGTASPAAGATTSTVGTTSVSASDYTGSSTWAARFQAAANNQPSGVLLSGLTSGGNVVPGSLHVEPVAASSRSALIATYAADSAVGYFAINRFSPSAGTTTQHFKIADDGVATWSNVGGVAGTAMTLNSTGLGVGTTVFGGFKLAVGSTSDTGAATNGINVVSNRATFSISANGAVDATGTTFNYSWANGGQGPLIFRNAAIANVMTLDASGNVGVGVTPSASGGCLQLKSGITFPATQVASSDANTLDDYEEGTFTPTIVGSTSAGTGTYTTNTGKYTKIGNFVTFQVYINWTAHTGTGNMRIGNLPFTNGNAFWAGSFGFIANIALTAGYVLTGYVEASSSYVTLSQTPVGGGVASDVPIDTAGTIVFSASYTV